MVVHLDLGGKMFEFLEFWMAKFLVELGLVILIVMICVLVITIYEVAKMLNKK